MQIKTEQSNNFIQELPENENDNEEDIQKLKSGYLREMFKNIEQDERI